MAIFDSSFIISIIGIFASAFSLSSTIPQIIKALRTKKMDDVSTWLIISLIIGLSMWIIYGIGKSDPVIVGGNAIGVSLNVALLALKFKYSGSKMGGSID